MAFVRPQLAGPQRETQWANMYAGAVGELNQQRNQSGQQNLQIAGMEDARNAQSLEARTAAWQRVTDMMRFAHDQNMRQKELNAQRSANRNSLGLGIAQTGVQAAGVAADAGAFEGWDESPGPDMSQMGSGVSGANDVAVPWQSKMAFSTPNVQSRSVVPG